MLAVAVRWCACMCVCARYKLWELSLRSILFARSVRIFAAFNRLTFIGFHFTYTHSGADAKPELWPAEKETAEARAFRARHF